MPKKLFLTDTMGRYPVVQPRRMFIRAGREFWYGRLPGNKRFCTNIRYDAGERNASRRNAEEAERLFQERLSGKAPEPQAPTPTLFEDDIETFLTTFPEGSREQKEATVHMGHWRPHLAQKNRSEILPSDIKRGMAAMVKAGLERSTANRVLTTLRACFRDTARHELETNPCHRVKPYRIDKRVPGGRAVALSLIERILATMPALGQSAPKAARPLAVAVVNGRRPRPQAIRRSTVNKTHLRLALMAYTGLPPALMAQIDPVTDIHWHRTPVMLRVRPRKKGGGTDERWVPLQSDAVDTLRAFVDGEATGCFSTSAAYKSWGCACRKVITECLAAGDVPTTTITAKGAVIYRLENGLKWELGTMTRTRRGKTVTYEDVVLPRLRPYDIRHSFITKALRDSNGNLAGTQYLAIHGTPQQTMVYAEGAKEGEALKVVAAMGGRKRRQPGTVLAMGERFRNDPKMTPKMTPKGRSRKTR